MITYMGKNPTAFKFRKGRQVQADIAWSYLDKTTKRTKKWVNKKQQHTKY